MITIIDSLRHSEEHAPFNAAFLTIINKSYSNQTIDAYFQKNHIEILSTILEKNNISTNYFSFHEIYIISHQNNTLKILLCYIISLWQDIKLLIKTKRGPLFYTSINPFSLFFIKLINIILSRNIFMVLHGELEYLNRANDKAHHFPNNLLRKWYRFVFWKLLNKNIKYIILGENIVRNIKKLKRNNFPLNNVITIDHPYFYPEFNKAQNTTANLQQLNIGTIGHAAVAKNSHKIFELAAIMASRDQETKITFKIIGNISKCMSPYKNKYVQVKSKKNFMPREIYEEEIKSLTYIVFFYPDTLYQFIASGAFFDAIAFEKPIISLHNSFFEYYFNKYNDIGFLCENIYEICNILENFNPSRYYNQVQNIKIIKEDLSLDKIAHSLIKQISED